MKLFWRSLVSLAYVIKDTSTDTYLGEISVVNLFQRNLSVPVLRTDELTHPGEKPVQVMI